MTNEENLDRSDPDLLLSAISKKRNRKRGGRLYLFIGMAPGVGKTYAMLLSAKEAQKSGVDVVAGVVETHGRKETEQLLTGLEIVARKKIIHRDVEFLEMDIDAILERRPNIALVDELAHTNIPGSRHTKRWQDVFELLDSGIDVYSTMNVQHLESRKDTVEKIAKISILEAVPDSVLDRAFQIQLIDLSVPDLLRRLKEGKIYLGEKADLAAANFFKEEKLTALREIALRVTAERVDTELRDFAVGAQKGSALGAVDRLLVAVGTGNNVESVIRATRKMAYNLDAPWIALHISNNELMSDHDNNLLVKNLELARNLGAEVVTAVDTNVVDAIIRIASQKDVSQIIVGRSKKKLFGRAAIHDQLIEKSAMDICVLGPKPRKIFDIFQKFTAIKFQSTLVSLLKAFFYTCAMLVLFVGLKPWIGYGAVGFLFLLAMVAVGIFLPIGSVLFASIIAMLGFNFFIIPSHVPATVSKYDDVFLCISFLVTAMSTGILTRRIKYHQNILLKRELRAQALHQILLDITTCTTIEGICDSVTQRVSDFLPGKCDILLLKKDGSSSAFFAKNLTLSNLNREMAVAKWAIENNKMAGRSTETLSSAEALYIPLKGSLAVMGALAYQANHGSSLSIDDMDFMFTVSRQVLIALERQKFHKRALESQRLAESEKVHQTLLELLAKDISIYEPALNKKMAFTINNFLLLSRLSVGIFPLKKEPQTLAALLGSALELLQQSLGEKLAITIEIEGPEMQVSVERSSMVQVFANILLNAVHYAKGDGIVLQIMDGELTFLDEGPGISDDDMGHLFEKFYHPKLASADKLGHGLGLAIAKGVIKAHEGKILLKNRPSGGLMVKVSLPTI